MLGVTFHNRTQDMKSPKITFVLKPATFFPKGKRKHHSSRSWFTSEDFITGEKRVNVHVWLRYIILPPSTCPQAFACTLFPLRDLRGRDSTTGLNWEMTVCANACGGAHQCHGYFVEQWS